MEEIENLSDLMELVFMVFLWRICTLFWDARDINKSKLGIVSSINEERVS